jgi:hypothetical protein
MVNRGSKELRPRKVMDLGLPPGDWNMDGMLDDKTWDNLKGHLPKHSQKDDARLRTALRKCIGKLVETRSNLSFYAKMAADVRHYEKLEKDLRRASITWKKIEDGPSLPAYPQPFDGLEAMTAEAKRIGANLRTKKIKTEPVGEPFNAFVRCIACCLREVNLNPTVSGRSYDFLSNKPSWFQKFVIALNAALPKMPKEPASNDRALAKKIMRAMKPAK